MERNVLRISTLVVAGALALRLVSAAAPGIRVSSQMASWLFFLQTGRLIRTAEVSFSPPVAETVPETTAEEAEPTQAVLTFAAESAESLAVNCGFDYSADLTALLTQPLDWNLTDGQPAVLILHSHATESYTCNGEYAENSAYHTQDPDYNMVSLGAYVAALLEAGGIRVLHDPTLHDTPSYNAAYTNSRQSAQEYLERYPSIRLVLDLHRDSYADGEGNQIAHSVFSEGTRLAQLMLVVGTDYGGLTHPQWQENLALALKLQNRLEAVCPGICRPINLRSQRFNQDLSTGALLVEVGASGNTRQEAFLAAEVLAEGILSLARGSR